MSILILGTHRDPHMQLVKEKLAERSIHYTFIDIQENFSEVAYIFSYLGKNNTVEVNNHPIQTFKKIYLRFFVEDTTATSTYSTQELCEKQEMWNFFLPIDSISNMICVNPVFSNLQMENKIFQLNLAKLTQIKFPKTLISCQKDKIDEFAKMFGPCIEKNLGLSWDSDNTQKKTRMLDPDKIFVKKNVPNIYQELIQKTKELRIYIIGNTIIPIEIVFTQNVNCVDWKESAKYYKPEYRLYNHLSLKTQQQLLNYHRLAKLYYAAYDFIINENNEEIFLECNPSGYWDFLPSPLSNRITETLVDELLY